jgi:hypothetical protein
MHGCGAHLCRFMLALESGYQFPSLLSLLAKDVFQVCRPYLVVRTHVENLVGQGGSHKIPLMQARLLRSCGMFPNGEASILRILSLTPVEA